MRFMKIVRNGSIAALLLSVFVAGSIAQTPSAPATPAKPKAATTTKPATATATYDRALLKPALLKDHAPETYQVKFETTRGDFTMTITRLVAARCRSFLHIGKAPLF